MCGHRCRTIARPIAIAIALTILAAGFADAADSAGRDKWQFDLALYAWGPTIKGDLGFDIPAPTIRSSSSPTRSSRTSSWPACSVSRPARTGGPPWPR